MPIYAYKCAECGHSVEAIQKVSDALLTQCPNCGKPALVKQVTAAGFQLKGGGWYVTDFRDSGKKKEPSKKDEKAAGDGSAAKSDSASDGGGVSKTADKGDSKGGDAKTDSKSEAGKAAPAPAGPPAPKPGASSGGAN